jgi:Lamin Tail Domain/CHU_C Type IX secretion signal domain/Bacterial Ig-like domain
MRKLLLLIFAIATIKMANAQINENFADGNFTTAPAWGGGVADFIVNPSLQLQSNNTVANSAYYLSTASTLATTAQWEFYCNLTFNTSSTNYVDVFLTASAADLTLNTTTGYFVRLGNTADEIALYKKDGTGAVTKIIDGVDGILNTSNNTLKIKVTRTSANLFTLSRDITGTGNSFVAEGTVTDATYNTSAFFGFLIRQSTASFFQRHFFDDILVQNFVPDITPPAITSVSAISATMVDVLFNEPVDLTSSQIASNYSVSNGLGASTSAVRDAANPALVHLTFGNNLPIRTNLTLTVNAVADLNANTLNNGTKIFSYFVPLAYDIVISEIMADPTPVVGLPTNEWLELKNTTTFDINLQNYKLGKPTGESGAMPNYILPAGAQVIVSTGSAVAAMTPFGATIAVTSFPSLNNDADNIYLRANTGLIMHSVNYTDDWYQNALKKDGGWTLEMIDPKNPCTGMSNWKASINPAGGTPAATNSVNAANSDAIAPRLQRAFTTNANTIVLVFNEPVDSANAAVTSKYTISDGLAVSAVLPLSPNFTRVQLSTTAAMQLNKVYTVTVNAVTDCSGNAIDAAKTARVGLADNLDTGDIVINEILFNPKPNANDFVELYNKSNKIVNLKNLYITNRSSTGALGTIYQATTDNYLFFPGDYIVLTEKAQLVTANYIAKNMEAFIEMPTLPSFNDDEGNCIILNQQGRVIDDLAYSEKWHFALIADEEGVSLERVNPSQLTVKNNFYSAATSVGYATPTYKNSQFLVTEQPQGEIKTIPAVVSPDGDGIDDFATIQYNFAEPGYIANISIFDAAGRPIRRLEQSALCGLTGSFRWDGLGDKRQKLAQGTYIIYTEVLNLTGKTKKFKNVIVLARRN